jgi:type II restriction/modification system DNA methylase subunit YeeA
MKEGGWIGFEQVDWFNGGLFDDDAAIPLDGDDIALVQRVAGLVWSEIDTSIFGTLFERGLDPDKRSQLGAHYTDREKIMLIVKPVIIDPWLAEWEEVKTTIAAFASTGTSLRRSRSRQHNLASATYGSFLDRLRSFRVLDPACGSGNFLYVALLALKDIEHRVLIEAEALGFEREFPRIGPEAVKGIEINAYAAELARVTVWIGEIQWMRRNGFGVSRDPILRPLDNIECRDALMNADGTIAVWPNADVAIGNPPFLGNKRMIRELTESYAAAVRTVYRSQLPRAGDLVCFWFAKAWEMVEAGRLTRAGFVATNSIRSGSSNEILGVISDRGRIFEAWDDEPWVVDGAAVRVSLIAFDCGGKSPVRLDGFSVPVIHSNLTAGNNITRRIPLSENMHVCFVGVILNGNFEITGDLAREFLCSPDNVNGRSNADVIRPTLNGNDFNGDRPDKWVIDFGTSMSEAAAALYERPFGFIEKQVKPYRQRRNEDHEFAVRARNEREIWWRHARARPAMRRALAGLERYVATPMVSSYRTFDYLPAMLLPDQKLVVFARDDDAFLGIVQSRVHHLWTIATCSWIGAGNDVTYPNTAVFETFPFPDGLTPDVAAINWDADPRAQIIAKSASRLRTLRDNWLHPGSLIRRENEVVPGYPDRIVPIDEKARSELKKRTLGNLYGEQPTWLQNAHRDLDDAVCAAYGWTTDISDDDVLGRLLELNGARAAAQETRPIRISRPGPQRTLLLPIAGDKEPVADSDSIGAEPSKKRERRGTRTA